MRLSLKNPVQKNYRLFFHRCTCDDPDKKKVLSLGEQHVHEVVVCEHSFEDGVDLMMGFISWNIGLNFI